VSIDDLIDRFRTSRNRPRVRRANQGFEAYLLREHGETVPEPEPVTDPQAAEIVPIGAPVRRGRRRSVDVLLIVTAAVCIAAAFATAGLRGSGDATPAPSPTGGNVTVTVTVTPGPSPVASEHGDPAVPAAAASPTLTAQNAAGVFVQNWLNTTGGHDLWLSRVLPLSTPQLGRELQATDVARIPHAQPVDAGLGGGDDYAARYTFVLTDDTAVAVALTRGGSGWLVSGIEPAGT
jgi:hypothetical protein